ncbi:hypothetical protein BMR1_03g02756 [Babesia microti strain RI]|uniref:Uncharacterized protein n=1 Tax=Babesia microti (strain RI) TaxID=1133968 RepID=A0A1R4ABV4_BABMR|nr:hypothetical protein BMR1_03g02756 [Babesia microti strain RI]SJK86499.1 hypothetical protein BMR1_03g02756 [Babesia microti strain RI]|eukprot:XP_021338653.1 hypothetical protein BMR1_03g02756 [Babesia microti strain RI]
MAIILLFVLLDKGSVNGLLRIGEINKLHDPNLENITTYWTISTVIESLIYTSSLVMSGYCIFLITRIKMHSNSPV